MHDSASTLRRASSLRFQFTRWGVDPVWPAGHNPSTEFFQQVLTDFTFWFFFKGRGVLIDRATQQRYQLGPGVCLCMFPGMDLEIIQDNSDLLGDSYIHFDVYNGRQKLAPQTWPCAPLYSKSEQAGMDDQSIRYILSLLNQRYLTGYDPAGGADIEAELLLKSLLIRLTRDSKRLQEKTIGSHHETVVATVLGELFSSPAKFQGVKDLTALSGYGTSHFRSLCQRYAGKSPNELLIQARIDKAKTYLLQTRWSIGRIAHFVGYENIYYFSQQFRKVTGMTASGYRLQYGSE